MRLICPNCGAQYEVDDAVIPDQGRDVQCSNCGHTWFQQPAHLDADLADELDQDFTPPDDAEDTDDAPIEKPALQRQELDPEIAGMLREEADLEAEARRAEADQLESQPDLGLDDAADVAASRSAAARARMARLRGIDEQNDDADRAAIAAAAGSAAVSSRRELLPDVEEINSTLRASEDRESQAETTDTQPKQDKPKSKGGRRAFMLILLIVLIGLAVYAFTPQIIASVPQAEPYLVPYVEWANGMRVRIDTGIQVVLTQVQGLIGSESGN